MALVTHQMQGPIMTSVSVPQWSKGIKLKQQVDTSDFFGKGERCMQLRDSIQVSIKIKVLRLSAFNSSAENGESAHVKHVSKVMKNSMECKDDDDSLEKTLKANNAPLSYSSGTSCGVAPPPPVNKLFKKWLSMLHTQQEVDEILGGISLRETSATPKESHNTMRKEILKPVWFYLLNLDAMIKIPLLIFIPLYLAINVFYGAQVSKELMPLWIFGPLYVAFYIKVLRWLCALSVLSFKQTAHFIKNLPCYYKVTCDYVSHVRLKGKAQAHIWQPVVDIRTLNYKELSKRKFKFMQEWIVEMYLDSVESVWPLYCRTIRFLKRSHFI